jgi:hypothetical protein
LKEILNEDRFDLNAFVDLAKKVLTETEFDKHVKPLVDIKEKIADYRTRQKVIQEQPIAALKAQVEELLVQTNLPVNDDYKDYTRQLALSCCTQELDSQAIILFEKASRPLIQEAYPQIGGAPAKMLLKTVIDNSKLKAGLAADHGMKVVYLANRQEQIHVTAKYSMLVAVYHEIATEQVVKAEQLPLYRFDVDLEAKIIRTGLGFPILYLKQNQKWCGICNTLTKVDNNYFIGRYCSNINLRYSSNLSVFFNPWKLVPVLLVLVLWHTLHLNRCLLPRCPFLTNKLDEQ